MSVCCIDLRRDYVCFCDHTEEQIYTQNKYDKQMLRVKIIWKN